MSLPKPHPFLATACASPEDALDRAQRGLRDMHVIRAYNHLGGRVLCLGTGIVVTEQPRSTESDETRLPKMQALLDLFAVAAGAIIADLSNGPPEPQDATPEEALRAARAAAAMACVQVVSEYRGMTRAQKEGTDDAPPVEAPLLVVPPAEPAGIVPAHDGKIILPGE